MSNKTISDLVAKIIPPNDVEHRLDFNNTVIISELSEKERALVEDALIDLLKKHPLDTLISQTLAYMKSEKAVPVMQGILNRADLTVMNIIVIAVSVFKINGDESLIPICIDAFNKLNGKYDIITAFYFLAEFKHPDTNKIIESYVNDPDETISAIAEAALKNARQ